MIENISSLNQTSQDSVNLVMLLTNAVPYVAYIGALGAAANAIFTYLYYIKNKPIVFVDFSRQFKRNKARNTIEIYISCMNQGDSAVTISFFGFYISELNKYITIEPNLFDSYFRKVGGCTRLEPGCSITAWIEAKDIEESLNSEGLSTRLKLFFFFKDGHGKAYICATPFYIPKTPDKEI